MEANGMETSDKKLYEAMFLVDPAQAANWDNTISTLKSVLERADGDIVSIRKWSERKLAYPIKGKTKGTYILCYFRADGGKIQDVEKTVQLSEQIIRVLILCAEGMDKKDIEKPTPAEMEENKKRQSADEASKQVGEKQVVT